MIRYELIKRISEQFAVEETEAVVFVDGIFESMVTAFKKGKKINIPEFGKFNVTNKIVDGVRLRYVVFSPARNFAEAINKDFSDLEPLVVNAYNLKKNERLKVSEVLQDGNEDDYLYFAFDTEETVNVEEEKISEEILQITPIVEEEKSSEDILPVIPEAAQETTIPLSETAASPESETVQSLLTEAEPIIPEEQIEEIQKEQSIFEEEKEENIKQTVFAEHIANVILLENPKAYPLVPEKPKDEIDISSINPEEQIAENEKIIDIVEHISPLNVRVKLKDDMNIDNIGEEIFDILVKREEIIRELNAFHKRTTSLQDEPKNIIEEAPKVEDIITPEETIESYPKPEEIKPEKIEEKESDLFAELERRIKELDELSQKKEEIKSVEKNAPMSQEMQIFGKLIDETPVRDKVSDMPMSFPEIIIHDPEPKKENAEPKSLSEALQNINSGDVIEHMKDDDDGVKSYDDIFRKSDKQFAPQFSVEPENKNTQGRFFKIFLYVFFIFLLTAFSFYIYKTMFTKSTGSQVIDTIGYNKIDSVRQLLKKTDDSIARKDTVNMTDETEQTESAEIKNINGVVYRELGRKIYIQNKVLDDLNEASDLELKLKASNLNCLVEGGTKIDNGLEYRVLVGPFKNIEEAMEYYEKHKVVLNFIQIINSNKPNLLVF